MFQFAFSGLDEENQKENTDVNVVKEKLNADKSLAPGFNAGQSQQRQLSAEQSQHLPPEFIPKKHTIKQLFSNESFRISIDYVQVGDLKLPKRPIYDMRYQVMKKNDISSAEKILLKESEDVRKNTYEGGLKVWECTLDAISYLSESQTPIPSTILELGAGAGLISAYILQEMIKNDKSGRLVVADYNKSVLELATAPNMLLTWLAVTKPDLLKDEELDLTPDLITAFTEDLEKRNIQLEFISGAWSSQFVEVLEQPVDFILASETIYDLETVSIFTETMLNCLKREAVGLVAAKKIYFGVGGGIPEFEYQLNKRRIAFESVYNVKEGVGREILRVQAPE